MRTSAARRPAPPWRARLRRVAWALARAAGDWLGRVERTFAGWRPERLTVACRRCGQATTPTGCPACAVGARPLGDAIVRLGPYAEPLRGWLLELKRQPAAATRGFGLGRLLGRRVRRVLATMPRRPTAAGSARLRAPIVVPVPMAPWRRFRAGVDHARVLAEGVAVGCGGSVVPVLRRRGGRRQAGRSRAGRRRGAGRGLAADPARAAALRGRIVVLVDDVVTTGATVRAAVRRLRRFRPAGIVVATVSVRPWTGPPLDPRRLKKLSTFPLEALTGAAVCLQSRVSAEVTRTSGTRAAPNLLEK